MSRKYLKVTGWWVYVHRTPNGMYYVGYSGGEDGTKQINARWYPTLYKSTTLYPYIKQYGWKNIKHLIVIDNLTEDEALHWEDKLICMYKQMGCCINKYRSNRKSQTKEYKKQYYQNNKNKIIEKNTLYNEKHREEKIEYYKKLRSTPEGKIYVRVTNYNRLHPDRIQETPLEAKQKYLQWGYIPDYIKNDDLH